MHAKELQKRLDAKNVPIIVSSIHPGGVLTGKFSNVFTDEALICMNPTSENGVASVKIMSDEWFIAVGLAPFHHVSGTFG